MPKGWRNESARHALAAKGIKTGRKPTKVGTVWTTRGEEDKLLWFSPHIQHHPSEERVVEVEWADGTKETFFAWRTSYGPSIPIRDKKGRTIGYDKKEEYLKVHEEDGPSIRINMDEVKQVRMYTPKKYFKEGK